MLREFLPLGIMVVALQMVALPMPALADRQPDPEPQALPMPEPPAAPLRGVQAQSPVLDVNVKVSRIRSSRNTACRMARYIWLEKAAEANPAIIAAITEHWTAARILARHHHLSRIADADHYVCRRITRYKTAARILAKNGEAEHVIALDPEGIYYAIKRDRMIAKLLAKNPMFDQMIVDNPDLGKLIATYM